MTTQTLKGFRDFLPTDARKRIFVISILKKTFESYGFDPLETPILEYEETLTGKYGDEGDKLMYKFEDNGGRRVAMRYDQTVPLARVIAQYSNEIPLPFKRYQIQNVYRAENTQKGRYREFMQIDVDTIGSSSLQADAEIIKLVIETYKNLGIKNVMLEINDRSNFAYLEPKTVATIDKYKKIGEEGIVSELVERKMSEEKARQLLRSLLASPLPKNLQNLFYILETIGLKQEVDFKYAPTLARGLDYYTGAIFELVSSDYENSLGGGGRYDKLIGMFADKQVHAVGFSFGFDRTIEAMDEIGVFPKDLGGTEILVTNTNLRASIIASEIRTKKINTELFVDDKELDKQLKYADKKGIPFVVIVEEDALTLKNMNDGSKKPITLEDLPDAISKESR
jgi:histidyl-tRNA synthetase